MRLAERDLNVPHVIPSDHRFGLSLALGTVDGPNLETRFGHLATCSSGSERMRDLRPLGQQMETNVPGFGDRIGDIRVRSW